MKEIIAYGQYLDEHNVSQGGHDLKSLWAAAKSYIQRHYQAFTQAQLGRVEQLVCELHELDPTSEATRYPFVKSRATPSGRTKSFADDAAPINLDVLAEKIRELGALLNDIANYLSVCQDLEAEFRTDYYRS